MDTKRGIICGMATNLQIMYYFPLMMEQMNYLKEMMEELYMELTNDSNHQPSSYWSS